VRAYFLEGKNFHEKKQSKTKKLPMKKAKKGRKKREK